MDGVGEIDVAKKLTSHKLMTALTKQHEELFELYNKLADEEDELKRNYNQCQSSECAAIDEKLRALDPKISVDKRITIETLKT